MIHKPNYTNEQVKQALDQAINQLMDGLAGIFPGCELTLIVRNNDPLIIGADTVISCEPNLEDAAKALRSFIEKKNLENENVRQIQRRENEQ